MIILSSFIFLSTITYTMRGGDYMSGPKKTPTRINNAFIKNALASIGRITVESVGNMAPTTRDVVKENGQSIANIAKSVKEDPTVKGQFKRISDKIMNKSDDEVSSENSDEETKDYRDNVKLVKQDMAQTDPFNISHSKNNYFVQDLNYKFHAKAVFRTISAIGQSTQSSLCKIENTLNLILNDIENDLNFFGNTLGEASIWSNEIGKTVNNFKKYNDAKTGMHNSSLNVDAVLGYIRAEKMFSIGEVVSQFMKNRSVNGKKEGDVVGIWLANTFTSKAATALTFMTSKFAPKNIRELGDNVKSTILNINTIVRYTLKDMSESDDLMSVLIAEKLGFKNDKSKVFSYKKTKVSFDGIIKRAIVRTIPTLLSKILTAVDKENYPDELTYDYEAGVFTKEKDVRKKRKKYKKVLNDYKGVNNLKEFSEQNKAYNKFRNRYSSDDKIDKNDYSMYEDDKYRVYKYKRHIRNRKGMKINLGVRITGSLENKLNKLDKWLFNLPADEKSTKLFIQRVLGIGNTLITDSGMPDVRTIFGFVANYAKYRLPEKARDVINKIFHIQLQPLSFYIDKTKEKVVSTLRIDYFKELYSNAKVKVKDFINGPVTDIIVKAKVNIGSFITLSLMRFTRFLNNQTQMIRSAFELEENTNNNNNKNKISRRTRKKIEVANAFKNTTISIDNIRKFFISTMTGPIREQYKIYGSNYVFNKLKNIDDSLCRILYKNGIEPDLVPHIKYTLNFKDNLKKWLLRPLTNTLGYFRDVIKEINIPKKIWKTIKTIPKMIRSAFKAIDHAISVIQGLMKVMKPILKFATDKIYKGIDKISDIHKIIMSHTRDAVRVIFTDTVPKIIRSVADIGVEAIKAGGKAAKFAGVAFLRLTGTALHGGVNVVNGLIKGAGKFILTLDEFRKHIFIKNKATYEGNLVGGKLDYIRSSVEYTEVRNMKDVFSEEDAEDRADRKKTKSTADRIRGIIKERIGIKMKFISNILYSALGFASEMAGRAISGVASFALGGTVGTLISKFSGKISSNSVVQKFKSLLGKKKESNDVMKVYIVGGSVEGSNGDSDEKGLLDSAGDVIDNTTDGDNKGKIKNLGSKLWKSAKKHKKALGIGAAVTAAVGAGAIISKKNSDSNEESIATENRKEEVQSLNEISNEIGQREKSNKLIDRGKSDIKLIEGVPAKLAAAENNNSTNDKEAFNFNNREKNNEITKNANLFTNEIATTENKTETVDKLVANKRSQIKVDDRNEKALFGKLTDEEKLERLSQQGTLGVIGEVDKPMSPAKLNETKSSFRGILEAWKYGVAHGGMLGGAFYALGAKHIINNKKLMAKANGMSEDEFTEYLKKFSSGSSGNSNSQQNSTADPSNPDGTTPDNSAPGENTVDGFLWPVPGVSRISSPFGPRICPFHGREIHSGIDIAAGSGKSIIASRAGKVVAAGPSGSYGNFTQIEHDNGYMTCYAHQSKILVTQGQNVSQGQEIGKVGSTGNSTGPHLHFEVRKSPFARADAQDPTKFVKYGDGGTSTAKASYITGNTIFDIDDNKLTGKAISEDELDEYPDPNYLIEQTRKQRSTHSGGHSSSKATPDIGDMESSSTTTVSDSLDNKLTNFKASKINIPSVTSYISDNTENEKSELDVITKYMTPDAISVMSEVDTNSMKKVKNTVGLFNLNKEIDDGIRNRVYATLVALLEELNNESSKLKDSANIAVITEVKKQIQEVENRDVLDYSDIVNINNSIMKIAAGY